MKRKITLLFWLCIPLFCLAQNQLIREYEYDAAGNRTLRKTVRLQAPPEDSLPATHYALQDELPSFESQKSPEYYVEKLAQVEMKIYPNPATEKITLAISNMEKLQTGTLQLYTLNGQLLQTQPIHSSTNDISLVNLAKGAYILKVQINDIIEEWKIVKQ